MGRVKKLERMMGERGLNRGGENAEADRGPGEGR